MFNEDHTFKDKTEIACTTCCGILCFISIGNVVSLVALGYAYTEYEKKQCTISSGTYEICSAECNPGILMAPSSFLQLGAFTMIGLSLISLAFSVYIFCKKFLRSKIDNSYDYDPLQPETSQLVLTGFIAAGEVALSVYGLLINAKLKSGCKDTPKGKMLLAWTIIYLIFGVCQCCGVCNTQRVLRLQRRKQKANS